MGICTIRPYRLTVRTQGSHPCNPGSIPGEVTKKKNSSSDGFFFLAEFIGKRTRRFEFCHNLLI